MVDAPVDPSARRYGVSYSIYGEVDVDALLAAATPWAPFNVWRQGDPTPRGEARTSGVTIDICEAGRHVEPAILRFLMEERVFLAAAARLVSPAIRSVLTCRMWIHAAPPSQIVLSATAVTQLAGARVELEVVGYPGPTLGCPGPTDDR